MKYYIIGFFFLNLVLFSCKTTRQINKVIAAKDSTSVFDNKSTTDSINMVKETLKAFNEHYIDFKTFSAKIKVDIEDSKGKQPDLTAVVRIIKDSVIWISLSASILNIEVYRILIKKDTVILLNKQNKEVQYRSIDYLQEVAEIPVDFKSVQDLLIGNPVFFNDSINSYKQVDDLILITCIGEIFKNLLTLSSENKVLKHIKLDDINISRNRTADFTYDDYENNNGFIFSTFRQIIVTEKNKLEIKLKYKQYEFNKELSLPFNIPKNYKKK